MEKQKDMLTSSYEDFRNLVKTAHQSGEHSLLIWKNEEERANWGNNEEKMIVQGVWVKEGIGSDGEPYGQWANMELPYAMKNVFEYTGQFNLASVKGNGLAAMGFKIDNLLANEGHMMFAHRSLFFKHLRGPIISIPSCKVIG